MNHFSPANLQVALVVVKKMWDQVGNVPLSVQLAEGTTAEQWAWEQEARRLLVWNLECGQQQRQLPLDAFFRGAPRPPVWDEVLVGEVPGMDDPILRREMKERKVFYGSGEQNVTVKFKRPVTS